MTEGAGTVRSYAKVVAVSGALLGTAASFASRGISFNPNRVVDSPPVSLVNGLGAWGWVLVGVWILAAALSLAPLPLRVRGIAVTLLGGGAFLLALWRGGAEATAFAQASGEISRTSLMAGFWVLCFASYAVVFAATAWLEAGPLRAALAYLPIMGALALAAGGRLGDLAVAREYQNNAEEFMVEFRLHLFYVLGAVSVGLIAGLLLGLLAARRRSVEPLVFGTLNVLQVVPTLAFIGLMYPLLTGLSDMVPLLEQLGVRGVGWAPVIMVLAAYATYPIARNTYAALSSLDEGVLDAGRSMGMGRMRMLVDVELPLALPVIVAGLRVALVQTTAGAIIAGLIGGGGLGTFVFLGAGETASDMILLGVLPIVAIGLFFDRSALAVQQALQPWNRTA